MVIEYARNILGYTTATSTEFDPETDYPVIATLAEQQDIVMGRGDMGGTMRLGSYDAKLEKGSLAERLYGRTDISERHRHRYEVNNLYRAELEAAGLIVSGTSPDRGLVEFVELSQSVHPYYIATQGHPEFKSRPTHPHPLFAGLAKAAVEHNEHSEHNEATFPDRDETSSGPAVEHNEA
jgi:CTP synthase